MLLATLYFHLIKVASMIVPDSILSHINPLLRVFLCALEHTLPTNRISLSTEPSYLSRITFLYIEDSLSNTHNDIYAVLGSLEVNEIKQRSEMFSVYISSCIILLTTLM